MKVRDRIVSWATLLCFFAGAAFGLLWPDIAPKIEFIGTAYVTALKYLALPALIVSVFHAALGSGKARRASWSRRWRRSSSCSPSPS